MKKSKYSKSCSLDMKNSDTENGNPKSMANKNKPGKDKSVMSFGSVSTNTISAPSKSKGEVDKSVLSFDHNLLG